MVLLRDMYSATAQAAERSPSSLALRSRSPFGIPLVSLLMLRLVR